MIYVTHVSLFVLTAENEESLRPNSVCSVTFFPFKSFPRVKLLSSSLRPPPRELYAATLVVYTGDALRNESFENDG